MIADSSAARRLLVAALLAGTMTVSPTRSAAQSGCSSTPLAIQILGSGGPSAGGSRASSGYLVWRAGRAVMMVDAGGGTFLRFGEAAAALDDLDLLAISHLHPDHVADLPALLWLSDLARVRPLPIAGPSGGGVFPDFESFLARLFDISTGAFPILSGTLGQAAQGVRLEIMRVDAEVGRVSDVFSGDQLEVSAIGVPHGDVPTIAYRVRIDDRVIVFGSDQNGSDPGFVDFASGADVLVLHSGVSQHASEQIAQLHARPETVGRIAQGANARLLILSHFMEAPASVPTKDWFTLFDLSQAVADVRGRFSGEIIPATDLQCIPVP